MNPEQIAAERKKYGLPEQGIGQGIGASGNPKDRLAEFEALVSGAAPAPQQTKPMPAGGIVRKGINYAADVVKEGAQKISADIKKQGERFADSPDTKTGNLLEKPAILGQSVGMVAKDALITAYTPIGDAIDVIADKIADLKPVQRIAATKAAGAILDKIGSFSMTIEDLKKKHPDLGEAADQLLVIGGTAAGVRPAGAAVKQVANTAKKTAKGAGEAAELVAQAAKEITPGRAPCRSSFSPQTAKEFAEEGIVAPVSAMTDSPFLKAMEAMSAKGVFGKKVMEQIEGAREAVDTKIAATADAAKPKKAMSDEALGKTMADDLRAQITSFKDKQDKIYTEYSRNYGAAEEYPENTVTMLREIVDDQGEDFFRGVDPRVKRMYDRLTGEAAPEVKELRKEGLPDQLIESEKTKYAPQMTVSEMHSTRTAIGEAIVREPDNAALKRLYGALTQDIDASIGVRDKAAASARQKMDADYAAGISRIEGRIAQSIEQANPENIVHKLMTRDSADAISVLKTLVKPETFAEYRKFFLREAFENSVVRGKFSVEKLKQNLAEYDDATLDALLDGESRTLLDASLSRLERLDRLSDALKPQERILGGSQTAFLQQATAPGTMVGAIGTALITGQFKVAALLIGGLAGKYGVSKLFTTEAGRKLLTEGYGSKSGTGARKDGSEVPSFRESFKKINEASAAGHTF